MRDLHGRGTKRASAREYAKIMENRQPIRAGKYGMLQGPVLILERRTWAQEAALKDLPPVERRSDGYSGKPE